MQYLRKDFYLKNSYNFLLVLAFALLIVFSFISPAYSLIDYGKQSLMGADFSNSDLRGANFYLSNLQDADLSGSDLEGASLFDAKLKGTNLSNTNLENATLDSAIIDGADLTNAYLKDAFAFNTRFINVDITGSDFTNVFLSTDEHKYLCSIATGINPISNKKTLDTLDCE